MNATPKHPVCPRRRALLRLAGLATALGPAAFATPAQAQTAQTLKIIVMVGVLLNISRQGITRTRTA